MMMDGAARGRRRRARRIAAALAVLCLLLLCACGVSRPPAGPEAPAEAAPYQEGEPAVAEEPEPEEPAVPEEPRYAPGTHLYADGRLFACDADGEMIRDGSLGCLYFDADGIYTCGNGELDAFVTGWIAGCLAENPDAERIELLRAAYDYVRDSYTFVGRTARPEYAGGWEIDEAVYMLGHSRGNCFNYAGVFWALSRGLGYPTVTRARTVGSYVHGWTDIPFDGTWYIFDPCLEQMRGSDRFMLNYEDAEALQYPGYPDEEAPETYDAAAGAVAADLPEETAQDAEPADGAAETAAESEAYRTALTFVGWPMEELRAAIGEPEAEEYVPSCLGSGKDGVLTYPGFTVYTYREGGTETVRAVALG